MDDIDLVRIRLGIDTPECRDCKYHRKGVPDDCLHPTSVLPDEGPEPYRKYIGNARRDPAHFRASKHYDPTSPWHAAWDLNCGPEGKHWEPKDG